VPVTLGTPQGTIVGPAGWLPFFDGALERRGSAQDYNEEDIETPFADDLVLAVEGDTVEECCGILQRSVDTLADWCRESNMELSDAKTTACIYSTDAIANEVSVKIGGKVVKTEDAPRFLGVLVDRGLTFEEHGAKILDGMKKRLAVVRRLARMSWCPINKDIKTFYMGFVESYAFYAAAAWMPMVSRRMLEQIEKLQQQGANIIRARSEANCNRSVALFEAGLVRATYVKGRECAILRQIAMSREEQNPNDLLLRAARTTEATWARIGAKVAHEAGVGRYVAETWYDSRGKAEGIDLHGHLWSGSLQLVEMETTAEDIAEAHEIGPVYYCDGAAQCSIGAAACIGYGKGGDSVAVESAVSGSRKMVLDAFTAEQLGWILALEEVKNSKSENKRWTIFTDALSCIQSVRNPRLRDEREEIISRLICEICNQGKMLRIQFTRSHKGTEGNEKADRLAEEARQQMEERWRCAKRGSWPIPKHISTSRLKTWARNKMKEDVRQAAEEGSESAAQLIKITNLGDNPTTVAKGSLGPYGSREEIILNHMRIGSSVFLDGFKFKTNERKVCRCCGRETTPQHFLLHCPAFEEQRQTLSDRVKEELVNRHEKRAEWNTARGREVKPLAPFKGLRLHHIGTCPRQVLDFIKQTKVWLDEAVDEMGTEERGWGGPV